MGFLSSLFGSKSSAPASSTNVVSQRLPTEIAPQVEEIAKEAQRLYEERVAEGYVPYEGATIAPFTADELAAQTGIRSLVGTSAPLQEESLGITRQGSERFTGDIAQEYMNPYQQAVIDIEKRKAQEDFESRILPQFEKQAVDAGGMSGLGSRAGVQAALLGEAQAERLGDIQSRGLRDAFTQGRKAFEDQKARERLQAAEIARLGPAMFSSGLTEQGALATVGEDQRNLAQSALDEAYFRFQEERQEPQRALAEYSGQIYANPLNQLPTRTETGTSTPYKPSFGQQLLGIGTALGSAYLGGMGGSAPRIGGRATAKTGGGLSDLIYRQVGGPVEQIPTPKLAQSQIREAIISKGDLNANKDRIKGLLAQLGTDRASKVLEEYRKSIENVKKLIPTELTPEQKRQGFLRDLSRIGVEAGLAGATSDKGFLTGALEGAEKNIKTVLDKDAKRNDPEEIAKRNLQRAQTALTLDANQLTFALKNQEVIQKRTKALLDAAKVSTADQFKYLDFLNKVMSNQIKIGELSNTQLDIINSQPELMKNLLSVLLGIPDEEADIVVAAAEAGSGKLPSQDRGRSKSAASVSQEIKGAGSSE